MRKCGINELEQTAMAISDQQTSGKTEKFVDSSPVMGLDTWQAAIFKVNYYYYYLLLFVLFSYCLNIYFN